MSIKLEEAIEDFDRDLPTDWRVVRIERDGVLWVVTVRHQMSGQQHSARSFSLDGAAGIAATLANQAGQGLAEYGLILMLVVIVVVVVLALLGVNITGFLSNIGTTV